MGAIVGGAGAPPLARALRWAGGEIRTRLFSSKEEMRIGGALAVAVGRIEERKQAGEEFRQDGLFDPGDDPRGILEGTLLSAARSYDQKKVPFIGAFYASFAFESEISPNTAHYLLRLLDRLTYRQLCVLAYLSDPNAEEEKQRIQVEATEHGDRTSPTVSAELSDLANEGLIGYRQDSGAAVNPLATWGAGQVTASSIVRTVPTELGRALVRMAELEKVPEEDRVQIAAALRGEAS